MSILPWVTGTAWAPPFARRFLAEFAPTTARTDDTRSGTYASVIPCIRKTDNKRFAARGPRAASTSPDAIRGWHAFEKAQHLLAGAPHTCVPIRSFIGGTGAVFVMPLRDLGDLHTWMVRYAPLSSVVVVRIAVQLCMALSAIHALPGAHGDIKPENILVVAATGANPTEVEVCDWDAFMTSTSLDDRMHRGRRGTEPYYSLHEDDMYSLQPLRCLQLQDMRALAKSLLTLLNRNSSSRLPRDPVLANILSMMLSMKTTAVDAQRQFEKWLLTHDRGSAPRDLNSDVGKSAIDNDAQPSSSSSSKAQTATDVMADTVEQVKPPTPVDNSPCSLSNASQ